MHKLRHLDNMIKMLTPAQKTILNMRPFYESALRKQLWILADSSAQSSEWFKGSKRIRIDNGDRMYISFDGITWKNLNPTARQRLLLASQF